VDDPPVEIVFFLIIQGKKKKPTFAGFSNCRQKGAVSKWLKQAMRGSTFFRNIFGQSKQSAEKTALKELFS